MEKKKKMNKKAQVSIEVLAILAILVIGSIIFGVYYLSMSRKNIEIAAKLDIGPELHIENGPDAPGTDGPPPPPPPVGGNLEIIATVTPDIVRVYEDFNINVEITALPTGYDNNTVRVTTISPAKDDGGTQDCNYINTPIPSGGLEFAEGSQIFIGNAQNQSQSIGPIDCSSSGRYEFTITADMDFNAQENNYDPTNDKFIRDFNLSLFLVPPFPALVNTDFTINADVVSYLTNKNVVIKKIAIDTNNVCDYNGTSLTTTGISPNYQMTPTGENYTLDLNLFSCTTAGDYNFTISAGELGSTDTNKNDTKLITKSITSPASTDLTLILTNMESGMIMPGFNSNVLATVNYLADKNIVVKFIKSYKRSETTGEYFPAWDCYYNGQSIPSDGLTGLNDAIPAIGGGNYETILPFYCCDKGTYLFDVNAGVMNSDSANQNDDDNETKDLGCEYTGGTGTLLNPKRISSPKDLFCVRYYLDSNFLLTDNINLAHHTLSIDPTAYWYDHDKGWDPIGNNYPNCSSDTGVFNANFNGNNKKIENLFIDRHLEPGGKGCISGLFVGLGEDANLYDLNINSSNLFINGGGALFGYNEGIVKNIKASDGNISGYMTMGGLGGCNYGKIYESNSKTSNIYLRLDPFNGIDNSDIFTLGFGGLIGYNKGLISQCFSTADVNGVEYIGGLVGQHTNWLDSGNPGSFTMISNSYAKGNLIDKDPDLQSMMGGLIGQMLVVSINGRTSPDYKNTLILENSYATGHITTSPDTGIAGGIIGVVSLANDGPGISGLDYIVNDCFWDMNTSDQNVTGYSGMMDWFGLGKTTTQMKQQVTFVPPWDFTNIWNINGSINSGYPHLRMNPPS